MSNIWKKIEFPTAKIWGWISGPKNPTGIYVSKDPAMLVEFFIKGFVISLSFGNGRLPLPSFRHVKNFEMMFDDPEAWIKDPANVGSVQQLLKDVQRGS